VRLAGYIKTAAADVFSAMTKLENHIAEAENHATTRLQPNAFQPRQGLFGQMRIINRSFYVS
jgi:hypothetical protein